MAGPTGPNAGRGISAGKRTAAASRPGATPPLPPAAPATARSNAAKPPAAAPAPLAAPVTTVSAAAAPVGVAPAPPVKPQAAAPLTAVPRENLQIIYGLIVVVSGFVAILIGLWLVVINYKTASDATAILGIITTAIAGLGGAFFGVAIGQQGTATANKERTAAEAGKDEAQMRALRFAANMDPVVARRLVE
jgi:hypothetical protein